MLYESYYMKAFINYNINYNIIVVITILIKIWCRQHNLPVRLFRHWLMESKDCFHFIRYLTTKAFQRKAIVEMLKFLLMEWMKEPVMSLLDRKSLKTYCGKIYLVRSIMETLCLHRAALFERFASDNTGETIQQQIQ